MQTNPQIKANLSDFIKINSRHKNVEVCPCPNNTFLLCKWLNQWNPFHQIFPQQVQLYSLDKKKIVFQAYLGEGTYLFKSSKKTHIIILNLPKHRIEMHDLQTAQVNSINHKFNQKTIMKCTLFEKSQIFCVFQIPYTKDEMTKLTFYSELKFGQNKGPLYQTTIKMKIPSKYVVSRKIFAKMNEHSKLAFFSEENGEIKIKTLTLEFNESKTRVVKEHRQDYILDIGLCYCLNKEDPDDLRQVEVIRQIAKNEYLIAVKGFSRVNLLFQGVFRQPSQLCILDVSDRLYSKVIPISIALDQKIKYDISGMTLLFVEGTDLFVFEKYLQGQKSFVFINMKKRQVVSEVRGWEKADGISPMLKDGTMLVEYKSDSSLGKIIIKMTDFQINELKLALLHLLLSLNQDFDDDLLQDSIDLLFEE